MFHYFLSLSTNEIIIISAQNLKLKITRKLNCTFPLLFLCVNSVITECYFIVIGIPYLFIDNLPVVDYLCPSAIFFNDGQKIIITAPILIYIVHRNNSLVT